MSDPNVDLPLTLFASTFEEPVQHVPNISTPQPPAKPEPEPTPMLDVHPPHQAAHTWRDFFIHIATISVGLLIAIGLEQSVEAMHRLHERHILEHDLREECELGKSNAENNLRYYDARMLWLLGLKKDLDTMIVANGKADLPYRRFQAPPGSPALLNLPDTAWVASRSEGKLTLLSDLEEVTYGILYSHIERWQAVSAAMTDLNQQAQSLADQFSDLQHFGIPAFSRMSTEQLVEYRTAIMNSLEGTRAAKRIDVLALGDADVLLHSDLHVDVQTLKQMVLKAENEEVTAHPDDLNEMSRQIEAQDAARAQAAKKASAEAVKRPQPKHAAHS